MGRSDDSCAEVFVRGGVRICNRNHGTNNERREGEEKDNK